MPTLDVLGNGSCRHVLSILVPLCCCRLLVQTDHVFPRARSVLRLLLCRLQGLLRCPACSRQSLELIRRRLLCAGFPGSCFLRSCCMGSLLELGNLPAFFRRWPTLPLSLQTPTNLSGNQQQGVLGGPQAQKQTLYVFQNLTAAHNL